MAVPLASLWIYLVLGFVFGVIGVYSNHCVLALRDVLQQFYQQKYYYFMLTGALLAGTFGLLSFIYPEVTGGGFAFIPEAIAGIYSLSPLFIILIVRFIATIVCFSSGAPGGGFSHQR